MEGLTQEQIRKEAQELYRAEREKTVLRPLTEKYPKIEPAESYRIQLALIEMKKADGAKVVGKKIGLTSKAMQKMLNVDQPDYGHILESMVLQDGVVSCRRADSTEDRTGDRLHSRPRDQRTRSHAHSGLSGNTLCRAGVGNHRQSHRRMENKALRHHRRQRFLGAGCARQFTQTGR